MSDLPKDEDGLKQWCEDRWVEKDAKLGEMVKYELGRVATTERSS